MTDLIIQASGGFILGYLVGLFIKTFSRFVLLLIGGFFAFLLFLQSLGWITIHWSSILTSFSSILNFIFNFSSSNVSYLLSVPVFGVSFAAGVYTSYILPKHSLKIEEFEYVRRK